MPKIESGNRSYTPFTKINSKWVRDIKMQNYKTLRRENLDGNGNDILNTTPTAWSVKEIIDKLDFIKIKTSLQKTSREWEDKLQTGRKYL